MFYRYNRLPIPINCPHKRVVIRPAPPRLHPLFCRIVHQDIFVFFPSRLRSKNPVEKRLQLVRTIPRPHQRRPIHGQRSHHDRNARLHLAPEEEEPDADLNRQRREGRFLKDEDGDDEDGEVRNPIQCRRHRKQRQHPMPTVIEIAPHCHRLDQPILKSNAQLTRRRPQLLAQYEIRPKRQHEPRHRRQPDRRPKKPNHPPRHDAHHGVKQREVARLHAEHGRPRQYDVRNRPVVVLSQRLEARPRDRNRILVAADQGLREVVVGRHLEHDGCAGGEAHDGEEEEEVVELEFPAGGQADEDAAEEGEEGEGEEEAEGELCRGEC
ncbi:hypothetical protein GRF29_28g1688651, partial [Pseudopithomyces chartarum]